MTLAFEEQKWTKFKESAHKLKCSASYGGAALVHYDCYFIQKYYMDKETEMMIDRYKLLIEDCIEFLLYC